MPRSIERPDRDDPHHAGMHVVEQVAVERPVAGRVGGQVEVDVAAGQDPHRVLERLVRRIAVDHLEEMAVDVHRVGHHRVVDQPHPHPLVAREADTARGSRSASRRRSTT